jgi:hypothetical protein
VAEDLVPHVLRELGFVSPAAAAAHSAISTALQAVNSR